MSDRILAIEVRSRRFGFAAFEGTRLLDWGIVRFKTDSACVSGFLQLNRRLQPSVLVTRRREMTQGQGRATMRAITCAARKQHLQLRFLREIPMKQFFERHGMKNKYQVAAKLAERFSAIKGKVPASRKISRPEHPRMPWLDATVVGIVFESLQHRTDPFVGSQPDV